MESESASHLRPKASRALLRCMNNDCEIVVDVANPRDNDVFLTRKVAEVGQGIVNTCLLGSSTAQDTIGVETVGPKDVVSMLLRHKVMLAQGSENLTDAFVAYTGVAPEASAYLSSACIMNGPRTV